MNTFLGTNLSGDDKTCLINYKSEGSYTELHFTDNNGKDHILIRGKHKYDNTQNFISLDGKIIKQSELGKFYRDKKLFLSIINPMYFLTKKPAEQKELVDKYLSGIKPKQIFDRLSEEQQKYLIDKYFCIPIKEIYPNLSLEELESIYTENNLKAITGKQFTEIVDKDKWTTICENVKEVRGIKYYEMLSPEEQEKFINFNMLNICMDIAYNNLSKKEQIILEGEPMDIQTYITDINSDIKRLESVNTSLQGKIEYAQNIVEEKLPEHKVFEKEEELSFARQELDLITSNQAVIDKERQGKIVDKIDKELLNKENELISITKQMEESKVQYRSIKNSNTACCPTCNQRLNENKEIALSNIKQKAMEYYNKSVELKAQIKQLKQERMLEKAKFFKLDANVNVTNSQKIQVVEKNINDLENQKAEIDNFNNTIDIKAKNIEETKKDIFNFNKAKVDNNKMIEKLKETKKVAQKLYIAYIEQKMLLVKEYLKDVNIKFYSTLKETGEIKEDFIITYQNKALCDLSRSETIATALELSNMFNKITKSNLPIFVDDYESCVDYNFIKEYSKESQIIVSTVKRRRALTISNYNNSAKCTIIKQKIKGFNTMKLLKKCNNMNLAKVA